MNFVIIIIHYHRERLIDIQLKTSFVIIIIIMEIWQLLDVGFLELYSEVQVLHYK